MLEIEGLSVSYGAVRALEDVSFSVERASVCAVVGANGAGKSTLMKAISGLVPVAAGEIRLDGRPIQSLSAERRVALGIALSPEGRRLFPELTVRENLLMGAYLRKDRAGIAEDLERVYAYFPRLREREQSQGRHLSGGEQQMCAIGRGLMSAPRLLMIDELSLGLSPLLVEQLVEALIALNREGLAILVVEQDVVAALEVSSHAFVMDQGRVVQHGPSDQLLADPAVRKAYLGALAE